MKHALGMIAFVLALVAIFASANALYLSGAALILASFAAYRGEKGFSLIAPFVVIADVFFLNPQTVTVINKSKDVLVLWVLLIVFLALPFISAALNATGAFDFSERVKHH